MKLQTGVLTNDLKRYINVNFEELFSLHPENLGEVLVYDRQTKKHNEKQIFRYYESYLESPQFDAKIEKSYMFSNLNDTLRKARPPELFLPFLKFAKSLDIRYNQMTVNWYEKDHYIEMHRDCTAKFISSDSSILCINLNETDENANSRVFKLEDTKNKKIVTVPLTQASYIIMPAKLQETHRHGVGPGVERRISITFRMIGSNK